MSPKIRKILREYLDSTQPATTDKLEMCYALGALAFGGVITTTEARLSLNYIRSTAMNTLLVELSSNWKLR